MSAKLTLGKSILNNKILHISNVVNGLKCNCVCPECNKKLVAVNKKTNKKEFHFRHHEITTCTGGVETALHELAKQIIAENSMILLSGNNYFKYTSSKIECPLFDIQPDIIIENEKTQLKWLVEVAVTSFINQEKTDKIKKQNLNCLEIDLKNVDRKITPEELKKLVLNSLQNRKIINRERSEKLEKSENMLITVIGIFLSVFLLKKLFK